MEKVGNNYDPEVGNNFDPGLGNNIDPKLRKPGNNFGPRHWPLVTGFWLNKDQYELITQVTSNQ